MAYWRTEASKFQSQVQQCQDVSREQTAQFERWRDTECARAAALEAELRMVRAKCTELEKGLACGMATDTGTVVLPAAAEKIFRAADSDHDG